MTPQIAYAKQQPFYKKSTGRETCAKNNLIEG
jgi:hypothetical protein